MTKNKSFLPDKPKKIPPIFQFDKNDEWNSNNENAQ